MNSTITVTPHRIIDCARLLRNTPFKHQGRTPGKELDCIGVIIATAKMAGVVDKDFDITDYPSRPGYKLQNNLNLYCVKLDKIQLGAIALFNVAGIPQHCAIVTDWNGGIGMLHAYDSAGIGRVTEHDLIPQWKDKIVGYYGFPKVDYASDLS